MAIYAAFAALVIGAAAFFSVTSASGGSDIRANLTLIAPAGPGGGWDTFQRESQQAMRANKLVNNVQVVNIPGAAGTIALGKLTTMGGQPNKLMVSGTGLVAGVAQLDAPVDHGDATPIARVVEEYDVVVVKADSPYRTLDDLVTAWKQDPAKVSWTGGGTFDQLVSTDLALKAGIDPGALTYIPKSGGGEATTALLNGTAVAATSGYMDMADQIEAGRLRALGLAAPQRLPGVDIPTLTEQGYETTLANWRMVVAPPGITAKQKSDIVDLVTATVATPEWKSAQQRNRWTPVFLTGPELDSWLAQEEKRIAALVEELK
ncbi:tripartite tricarboxylate transporter substrate binding protein [Agilicoccus flavus]|uniref:tripartite tricarboxylate transporter substrate binding protein n=1 Tax=Agilicoccus flavus TaxID=2775968 RepID=UPI001CF6CDB6